MIEKASLAALTLPKMKDALKMHGTASLSIVNALLKSYLLVFCQSAKLREENKMINGIEDISMLADSAD